MGEYGEGPRRKGEGRSGGRGLVSEDSGLTWQQQQLLNSRELVAEGGDMGEGRRGEKGQVHGGKRGVAAAAGLSAAAGSGGLRKGIQPLQQVKGKGKQLQQQGPGIRPRSEEDQYLADQWETEDMFYGEPPPLRGFNQADDEFYYEPEDPDIPQETVAAAQQAAMFSIKCVEKLAPTLAEHAAHAAAHPVVRKPPVAAEVVKVANEAAMAAITGLHPSAKSGRGRRQSRGGRGDTSADMGGSPLSGGYEASADQAHSAASAALRKALSPGNSGTSQGMGEGVGSDAWGRDDSGSSQAGQQQQRRAAAHTNLFTSVMTQLRRQVDSGEDLGADNKGKAGVGWQGGW
jgi:hypothetical protein